MMETERLLIRRFSPEDADDLYAYLSDPQVVFYEPYDVFTRADCEKEAARRAGDEAFWAVCLKSNSRLIGNIYLSKQDLDTWELGYVFNAAFQGKGYAAESARAVIDYAIKECGARRIVAMCNPDNEKSWKLLERLNMRREAHLKQNIYFRTDSKITPFGKTPMNTGYCRRNGHMVAKLFSK